MQLISTDVRLCNDKIIYLAHEIDIQFCIIRIRTYFIAAQAKIRPTIINQYDRRCNFQEEIEFTEQLNAVANEPSIYQF